MLSAGLILCNSRWPSPGLGADTCLLLLCITSHYHQNVAIRKVKVLKAPKFDLTKLMDVHGDYTEEVRDTDNHSS